MKSSFFNTNWKGPLAVKQLGYILVFSSIITLVSASVQIFIEYRNDLNDVFIQLNQIEKGYVESLSSSLWKLDDAQIRVELNDALSQRDIEYLEIKEGDILIFSAGEHPETDAVLSKTFDLTYTHNGKIRYLGSLKAVASLQGTYDRLVKRILYIFITQGIKTFLVSFFILFIIYRLVIRHLNDLARYSRNMKFTVSDGHQFFLNRPPKKIGKKKDELDDLATAINTMRETVSRDMADREKREREKENLEQQLRQSQKMESLGTLAGGIAHDFNNILMPILGNTELLMEDLTDDNRHFKVFLDEIHTSTMRARDLVKQILTFSRQEKHETLRIKIQPILKESIQLLRSTIPTSISITTDIEDGCSAVNADPTRIHQIILNLATNAFHAMEKRGGDLKISLGADRVTATRIKEENLDETLVPGPYVRLRVSDTGRGMDPETIKKIFDPFFTTKDPQKGTGLGLSMVHGIVKTYGGFIRVDSTEGQGSCFDIFLPGVEDGPAENNESGTIKSFLAANGDEHILVADDETAVLSVETQMLIRLGYRVTAAASGDQALAFFEKAPYEFDMVMTDMTMPGMTGDLLAQAVLRIRPEIPVVVCSGFSDKDLVKKNSGIRAVLLKPLVMSDLSRTLGKIFEQTADGSEIRNQPLA